MSALIATPTQRRFRDKPRHGEALAMDPDCFAEFFLCGGAPDTERTDDGVAIVKVYGPLEHHPSPFFDSYEGVASRVEAAMLGDEDCGPARAVVLCIDSPGGDASGTIDCHRKLRSLRKQHGIPLFAYANEMAASAGYAIASACDEIWLPDTGTVGSIGVIATMFDTTRANKKAGLKVRLVTSGAYKADNHADRPLTSDIEGRMQARVDALAERFFSVVAKQRGMTPEAVAALEAGLFIGQDAVDAGLADGVERWGKFLEYVGIAIDMKGTQ